MLIITSSLGGWEISAVLLFGLGAVVGLLGGFFGVGGGWIITPALNILGMPIACAVGTGLAYITGMGVVSAWRHRRHGSLEPRLAWAIGLAMVVSIHFGKATMMLLERAGNSGPVVRVAYILLLLGIGLFMLRDALRSRAGAAQANSEQVRGARPCLQSCQWKPTMHLPKTAADVSVWPLLGIGTVVGFLSGLLGVGGGFALMPVLVYLIGVPTRVAVGTSLVCILMASPFGVLGYTLAKQVEFRAAGVMIAGALIGAPVGVYACQLVQGRRLRLLYAVMIILGGVSVMLRQLELQLAAQVTIFSAAAGVSAVIILMMMVARRARATRARAEPGE